MLVGLCWGFGFCCLGLLCYAYVLVRRRLRVCFLGRLVVLWCFAVVVVYGGFVDLFACIRAVVNACTGGLLRVCSGTLGLAVGLRCDVRVFVGWLFCCMLVFFGTFC